MSPQQRPRGSMAAAAARQKPTGPQSPRVPVEGQSRKPPRVKPYKATFDLDPEQVRDARVWAARHGVIGVAPVVRALIQALTTDEDFAERVRASLPAAHLRPAGDGADPVKTTYDLDPPLYKAFKVWTAQHGTTGVAVLRVLLSMLATDKGQLADRLML